LFLITVFVKERKILSEIDVEKARNRFEDTILKK